jgi:hypothetical protein
MVLLEWQLSDYVASYACPNFGLQDIRGREDEVVDCHGSTKCIGIDIHLLLFLFFLPFKESEPASGMLPPLLCSLSCVGRGLQKFRFNISAVNSIPLESVPMSRISVRLELPARHTLHNLLLSLRSRILATIQITVTELAALYTRCPPITLSRQEGN